MYQLLQATCSSKFKKFFSNPYRFQSLTLYYIYQLNYFYCKSFVNATVPFSTVADRVRSIRNSNYNFNFNLHWDWDGNGALAAARAGGGCVSLGSYTAAAAAKIFVLPFVIPRSEARASVTFWPSLGCFSLESNNFMPKSATEIGLKQAENFANANDDDVVRECMRFPFCVCVCVKGGGTGGYSQAGERATFHVWLCL